MKYAGALMVIAGCGGFGFAMAAAFRREEHMLQQLRQNEGVIKAEILAG